MSIFKKLFTSLGAEDGTTSTPGQFYSAMGQKKKARSYGTPDYSAYVYIRPTDKIFRVSLTDQIRRDYKDISNQYELARKFYDEAYWRPVQIKDFRKSFDALSRAFELIAIWFCNKNKLPVENKDVFGLGQILGERVFNRDQMNVVNGILALIDKYEGNTTPVSDYDVKTHFISLGIIVKLFKEAVIGKNINKVPCTFEKMREKEAAKAQRKAEKKELGRAAAADPNLHAVLTIEREYNVAKNCLRGDKVGKGLIALNNTVSMATKRICKVIGVSLKENGQQKNIERLVEDVFYGGYVSSTYFDVAQNVIRTFNEHPNGQGVKKTIVQEMLQKVGSTIMPTLKNISARASQRKKILPDIQAPSFKSMESKNNSGNEIDKKFPDIRKYMEKANLRLNEGEFDEALTALRKVMELIAENLCKKYNLYFENKPTLENRIDAIVVAADYTNAQRDAMHKARILGNKGSHRSAQPISANKVTEAIALVKKCIGIFREEMLGTSGGSNSPKLDPDYYNNTRRYYGRWCKTFNRQDLMLNMDYVKLERRANGGDVEAMLDIASGFLNNKIEWDVNSLVCAPKSNMYATVPDFCDARYYYWILKACDTAYKQWVSGTVIPLTYIATALVEGMKFLCCHEMSKTNARASTQKSLYDIAQSMFSSKLLEGPELMINMATMLICMFEEYGEGDQNGSIIAPVQGEIRKSTAKWYVYLYNKYYNEKAQVSLSSRLLINEEDIGKTYAEAYEKYKK